MSAQVAHILARARERRMMITCAESCTGGMLAAALTDIAGASDVFERGFVTYSNASKTEMLGVPSALISAHGAVSEEVARAMAWGALERSHAGLCVAITGIAGPGGGTADKPEGRVCFGLAQRGAAPLSTAHDFTALGRANVRRAALERALALLLSALEST